MFEDNSIITNNGKKVARYFKKHSNLDPALLPEVCIFTPGCKNKKEIEYHYYPLQGTKYYSYTEDQARPLKEEIEKRKDSIHKREMIVTPPRDCIKTFYFNYHEEIDCFEIALIQIKATRQNSKVILDKREWEVFRFDTFAEKCSNPLGLRFFIFKDDIHIYTPEGFIYTPRAENKYYNPEFLSDLDFIIHSCFSTHDKLFSKLFNFFVEEKYLTIEQETTSYTQSGSDGIYRFKYWIETRIPRPISQKKQKMLKLINSIQLPHISEIDYTKYPIKNYYSQDKKSWNTVSSLFRFEKINENLVVFRKFERKYGLFMCEEEGNRLLKDGMPIEWLNITSSTSRFEKERYRIYITSKFEVFYYSVILKCFMKDVDFINMFYFNTSCSPQTRCIYIENKNLVEEIKSTFLKDCVLDFPAIDSSDPIEVEYKSLRYFMGHLIGSCENRTVRDLNIANLTNIASMVGSYRPFIKKYFGIKELNTSKPVQDVIGISLEKLRIYNKGLEKNGFIKSIRENQKYHPAYQHSAIKYMKILYQDTLSTMPDEEFEKKLDVLNDMLAYGSVTRYMINIYVDNRYYWYNHWNDDGIETLDKYNRKWMCDIIEFLASKSPEDNVRIKILEKYREITDNFSIFIYGIGRKVGRNFVSLVPEKLATEEEILQFINFDYSV